VVLRPGGHHRVSAGLVGDSLRNALGPSFGTIAFGSFVLTMVEIGKAAAERMRRDEDNRGNILVCLVTTCLECIYAIIEYISKFATLQAAMTGAAFLRRRRQRHGPCCSGTSWPRTARTRSRG
jgi:hypothetical protein